MGALPLHRMLLFAALVILTGYGFWSEKIPVNNHTGWDGKHYANLTIHFEELASQHQIDSYQYQRILTPVVIFYTAKIIGVQLNTDNIVLAFTIYNFILILLCALMFFKMCTFLNLSVATEVIGFSCLFLNYCILKNTAYYPVLTDTTAFLLGFVLTYFFIRKRNTLLYLIVLLSQFCYPLFIVVSAPLALSVRNHSITSRLQRFSFYKVLAITLMLLMMIGFYRILFIPDSLLPKYTMELNTYLLPISVIGVLWYVWKSITTFSNPNIQASEKLNIVNPLLKLLGIIFFILISNHCIRQISIPEDVFTPMVFINNVLQQSIDNPFVFLVAHAIYLGPGLLLLLLFYKPLSQTIRSYGDSAILYFIAAIIFSIGSETRQFIHFYPFVIMMLMTTINPYHLSIQMASLFAALSLMASKIWLPINTAESFTQYLYAQFPDQYYFMNHGPFMSNLSHLINSGVLIIELAFVWFLILKRKDEKLIAG